MKEFERMMVPVFTATLLNASASNRMPSTDAPLFVKNLVYLHLMADNRYHTEATIE